MDGADEVRAPAVPEGLSRVLLRLPGWLGDVVMAAPAVQAIAQRLPGATLCAEVKPAFVDLARLLPGVSEAGPAGRDRSPADLAASRRRLRAGRYDAAVVFPRGLRAALAPWLAGIPVRVGFSGRGPLLTHAVHGWRAWRRRHRSDFYGLLARPFRAEPAAPLALRLPASAEVEAETLLAALGRRRARPLVVLEAGASYGSAKCWPPERFAELARRLLADGADVLTVGLADARTLERRIAAGAGPGLLCGAGRTPSVAVLAGVLARADLVVSNDTGPMHLAAALATPVLALFGATDPVVSGPAGPGPRRLVYEPEPCSPCFLRTCPVPGHPCLAQVPVARVLAAAREMLAAGRSGPA